MESHKNKVHIFWTGGMDSTFRLMQLLTTTSNLVQPHYIVRSEESTGIEIDTMANLRRAIARNFPHVMDRFLPTIFINEGLIPAYSETEGLVKELRKTEKVNEQYLIMSNYCRTINLEKIEVALTSLSGEKGLFRPDRSSAVFQYFTYPTIELTKKKMFEIAKENKWDKILTMTSFCRRPEKNIKPCGTCGPCTDVVISGLGFRLPLFSLIKARLQIPFRKYWRNNYSKHEHNWLFKFIKEKLEHRL